MIIKININNNKPKFNKKISFVLYFEYLINNSELQKL